MAQASRDRYTAKQRQVSITTPPLPTQCTYFMNDAEYRERAEALYNRIEEVVDQLVEEEDAPLDYENAGGVLTLFIENTQTQVIISRQAATQQIWVAAKSGGYHFVYEDEQWRCTKTRITLPELLSKACSEQSHFNIQFPALL